MLSEGYVKKVWKSLQVMLMFIQSKLHLEQRQEKKIIDVGHNRHTVNVVRCIGYTTLSYQPRDFLEKMSRRRKSYLSAI